MAKQTKPSAPKSSKSTASVKTYKSVNIALADTFISFPANLLAASSREQGNGLRLAVVKDGKASPVSQLYTADNKSYFPIGQLGRAVEVGDELIPVLPEELASLKVESSKGIEITKFVPLAEVDPVFFQNSYVLSPNTDPKKGNPQAGTLYTLLLTIMVNENKVGMAKMFDRDKEYNVIIRPTFDGSKLMLHTIYTSAEVRNIDVPKADSVNAAHLEMFTELVNAISGHFDPASITSTSDNRLAALIATKTAQATGEATAVPLTVPAPTADTVMASLQKSLAAAQAKKQPATVTAINSKTVAA